VSFDWTINVGNLLTLLAMAGTALVVVSRHLGALRDVRAGLQANVDTLAKMEIAMQAMQADLHAMDKRLAILEALAGQRRNVSRMEGK
jgi:hypothetical protein